MSRLDAISGKMMHLAGQVGDSVRSHLPSERAKWLQAGMALGAAKTGTRVAGSFVRRNPAVLVAAVIGAGAAWYAVHRYRQKQRANGGGEVFEGQARRIEPRRTSRKSSADTREEAAARPAPRRRSTRARSSEGASASDSTD